MTRILLVDDHPAVRSGLALVLETEGVGTCSQAAGCAEALETVRNAVPDVALVDLSMNSQDTLALIAELRARRIPVLVCSLHEDATHVKQAMAAGAQGYITKCEAPLGVARAVRALLEGWMLLSPQAAEALDEEPWEPTAGRAPRGPKRPSS
jgi:DNA-binding NarL/FixJ family response regulator